MILDYLNNNQENLKLIWPAYYKTMAHQSIFGKTKVKVGLTLLHIGMPLLDMG